MKLAIAFLLACALSLSACGHKGSLKSPSQVEAAEQKKARKAEKKKAEEQKKKEAAAPAEAEEPK